MIVYTPPATADRLPVIDLAAALAGRAEDRRATAWEIHKTCRDTGFFYVTGHGVPAALCDAQLEWARRFFAAEGAVKDAVHLRHSKHFRGFEPIGTQALDEDSPPDLKESFYYGRDLGPEHPYVVRGVPNQGPNQWPELAGFRAQMEAYLAALRRLEAELLALVALSLELPEDYFAPMYVEPWPIVRLVHYPPHPAAARANQLGAGAHTDWGLITLLLQDDCGGLEVQNAAGQWIRATPIAGSFVVNLGDMVPRLTNGLYHSNMHRVLNNVSGRDRYSVPYFGNPSYTARIEPLASCVTAERPLAFAPATVGEHIDQMYRKTYLRTGAALRTLAAPA